MKKCYFCGQETNGKEFTGENIYHKKENFSVCDDCYGDDLNLVD